MDVFLETLTSRLSFNWVFGICNTNIYSKDLTLLRSFVIVTSFF